MKIRTLLQNSFVMLMALLMAAPVRAAEAITYFHNDISGSPMLATDSTGAVLWKENYRPYGDKLNREAASAANKIGYHGVPYDNHTGLSYMGARYYDPVIGRFTGVDPVGFTDNNVHSFNRYAYANNNPYKYTDPDGNYAEAAFEALSITIGLKSFGENFSQGKWGAATVDGVGVVADVVLAAFPIAPGIVGIGIQASRGGAQAAKGAEKTVYRLGESAESASRLGRKSAEAEGVIGHHGVSVSTTKPPAGTPCSPASCSSLEARGFEVRPTPTRNDPNHHTVVLPKPVTKEVAKDFNDAFGR